ncbi:ABC transporter substrate-binding protein [Parvimonas micra]|uniref:ABC transporter substrate-binding protein n=1 Tax=Parvimonas micra TaxID=33033 RepID=A0A9X3K951_9FIRM|nr:ABC transporter substrate-binding protein [Parvimonas micra]MCZ7407054.1 ABC transporter substrate-binding protein [Parvimonas micra]MCZ7409816.1 ABC transporter substrate-binding protein [Parvimonas micra]MCZ7411584.1 ABC transporter substrate-binding protein [Parvimonas micra]WBB37494.1 ABC transporter substrate-binding protein [Parvimonas micra]
MKKQILVLFAVIVLVGVFVGCSKQGAEKTVSNEEMKERVVQDISGTDVKIPPAKDIKRVVIVAPPITSVVIKSIPDQKMIVGLNDKAFIQSYDGIMEKVFPGYKNIETKFVGEDFSINKESLLALKPDIILYYGEAQKKNLENIGVPIINFFSPKLTDPKEVTIAWENLLCEIFETKKDGLLSDEWKHSEKLCESLLPKSDVEAVKALWIFRNAKGKLMVAGKSSFDAYAESYFKKAGIVNVADEIQGTVEVNMEQIQVWNPDMIFIFQGMPAKAYLSNNIEGQDWSMTKAFQEKKIYDIPKTTYSWAAPCMDSPLMPLWLGAKAYPKKFTNEDFIREFKDYYKRVYNISLTEQDIKSVLGLSEN